MIMLSRLASLDCKDWTGLDQTAYISSPVLKFKTRLFKQSSLCFRTGP